MMIKVKIEYSAHCLLCLVPQFGLGEIHVGSIIILSLLD